MVVTVWTDPSVSFKLRLLGSDSVDRSSGPYKRDNNPRILRVFIYCFCLTGRAGSLDQHGFAASIHWWILNTRETEVSRDVPVEDLTKQGAFLDVTLGYVDCTSAHSGMSRSAAFYKGGHERFNYAAPQ